MELISVFFDNFLRFDWMVFAMFIGNIIVYFTVIKPTNKINNHFVKSNQLGGLDQVAKQNIQANTALDKTLSTTELMQYRKTMNQFYALYSNLTSMFPLMGMLGTVCSLLPMVQALGSETSGLFFSALTSTFWGIIAALICKALDSTISYKIEDNEKYMEFLLKASVCTEVSAL